ncbi:MAG TPA: serine/threonine-protein kinase [Polyangia bacterium]|jgi:serine/threonine protein kinase|nr:serine/threonine-protein kinase [Polyangia bacterium]
MPAVNLTQRYRLVRTIASGGMAQVLEAASQGMDGFERRVAIKRLLPQHLRDGGRRRMFFDEASIGSRLHHGGVVQIMDYGLIDGAAFLAMEFVDGVDTLRALTLASTDRLMPEGIALHVISEVAHALAYIHDVKDEQGEPLGIVHRDVSPQNILLSWDGDVKLSDFGIALCMQREEQTAEGVVKGKLPYMAPEQALGERVNAAADVYALGATLATLLGGRAMGPAMTDEEAWARVVEARERGVSAAVAELIGACTCREPRDRLRAADVAAAAGSLAFQRLSRGARATLRDWLAPLKPKDQEGSALDDLMGLCLVPVAAQDDGGRTFTVSQMMPVAQPGQPGGARSIALRTLRDPRAARTSAPIEIQSYEPPTLTRGQRLARASRWAATALVVATAASFTAWKSGMGLRASSPAARTSASVAADSTFPSIVTPAPVPASTAAALADGGDPAEMHFKRQIRAPQVPPGARPSREVKRKGHGRPSQILRAPPAEQPGAALANGWLRVGGAAFFGGKITVDGDAIGFAPLERELPVGTHTITVVSPGTGQTLLRQTIRIGGHHTHAKALSLLR